MYGKDGAKPLKNLLPMHGNEILFLPQEKIDRGKWDECIANALNEIPYAYSWYLDCVCTQWDALVLNDYEAVFPLISNKKAGVHYLYQPFFTQQSGVFSAGKITEELVSQFLENIPERFKLIEINLNTENEYSGNRFSVKKKCTHHLLLNKDYRQIFSGYNENTKRNLKKAEKENLTVTDSILPEEQILLFRRNQGKKIKELKTKDYERLSILMTTILNRESGEIYGVRNINGEIGAAGFFVRSKRFVINLFPSGNEEGRKNGSMFLLIDFMLRKYAGTNLIFDFEGSEIPSIAKFYKGFGSDEVYYPFIRRNNLPWHLKWLKK